MWINVTVQGLGHGEDYTLEIDTGAKVRELLSNYERMVREDTASVVVGTGEFLLMNTEAATIAFDGTRLDKMGTVAYKNWELQRIPFCTVCTHP